MVEDAALLFCPFTSNLYCDILGIMAPPKHEMSVGLNKGHKTTKIPMGKSRSDKKHKIRPARLKGVSSDFVFVDSGRKK